MSLLFLMMNLSYQNMIWCICYHALLTITIKYFNCYCNQEWSYLPKNVQYSHISVLCSWQCQKQNWNCIIVILFVFLGLYTIQIFCCCCFCRTLFMNAIIILSAKNSIQSITWIDSGYLPNYSSLRLSAPSDEKNICWLACIPWAERWTWTDVSDDSRSSEQNQSCECLLVNLLKMIYRQ